MRLKFWFRTALTTIATVAGASVLYSGMMLLMSTDTGPMEALAMLPLYLLLYGAFLQLGFSISYLKSTVNLALSMGATRRDAFLGLLIVTLAPVLGNAVLIAVSCAGISALGAEALFPMTYMLPLALALSLFLTGVGLVIAMIRQRFGNAVSIAAGIFIVLLAVILGFCAGLGLFEGLDFGALLKKASWWAFTLAALVFYGIVLIPLHRTVSRCAVTI